MPNGIKRVRVLAGEPVGGNQMKDGGAWTLSGGSRDDEKWKDLRAV